MPRRSWYTSTCPEHAPPAPMPMVGMSTAAVTAAATRAGTHSRTSAKHPASSSARASSTTPSAAAAVLPVGRKPPSELMACGVRPTWPWRSRRAEAAPGRAGRQAASTMTTKVKSDWTLEAQGRPRSPARRLIAALPCLSCDAARLPLAHSSHSLLWSRMCPQPRCCCALRGRGPSTLV